MLIDDFTALIITIALFFFYHGFLFLKLRRDPGYTIQGVNKIARIQWAAHIMQNENRAVLAVQTLRNTTMAATFFASTAILLIIGILNFTIRAENQSLSGLGFESLDIWTTKILFIVSDLFVAFFSFAMVVRLLNHVGYQINLPPDEAVRIKPEVNAAAFLVRSGTFYSIGMRAYYAVVPLVFWFFGPVPMLVAMILLIPFLYVNDRSPRRVVGEDISGKYKI